MGRTCMEELEGVGGGGTDRAENGRIRKGGWYRTDTDGKAEGGRNGQRRSRKGVEKEEGKTEGGKGWEIMYRRGRRRGTDRLGYGVGRA